jgi:hypothetical protein
MSNSNVIPLSKSIQPFSVVRVRSAPKPGLIKAYVDGKYYDETIYGIAVIENKNGGYFVGFPSNLGSGGKRFPIVEFSEPIRSEVAKIVLEAARDLLR